MKQKSGKIITVIIPWSETLNFKYSFSFPFQKLVAFTITRPNISFHFGMGSHFIKNNPILLPLRLYLDQGFGNGKGKGKEKVNESNFSGLLDRLTFPFPFPCPSSNPRSKQTLKDASGPN